MKILVTGANGLIARKVIKQLSKTSIHKITATSQKPIPLGSGVESFTVNLIYADINKLVDTIRPDAIIHCAAIGSPDACEVDRYSSMKINVDVTARLASACRDYGAHLVFLSTDFVFDGKKGSYVETDPTAPISFYGETKLEAEKFILNLNIGASIVRTSLVFGYEPKLSRLNFVLNIVESLKKGKQYRVPNDQIRTPTFAEDLSLALIALAENRVAGIFHISGSEVIHLSDFAKLTAKIFNLNESLLTSVSTEELVAPAKRPLDTSFNINKAISLLNYKTTPLVDALHLIKEQYTSSNS